MKDEELFRFWKSAHGIKELSRLLIRKGSSVGAGKVDRFDSWALKKRYNGKANKNWCDRSERTNE
jgi:hypothetical protein